MNKNEVLLKKKKKKKNLWHALTKQVVHFVNYVPTAPCYKDQQEHRNKPAHRLSPWSSVGTIRLRPLKDAEFGETGFLSFKNSEEDCSTHL